MDAEILNGYSNYHLNHCGYLNLNKFNEFASINNYFDLKLFEIIDSKNFIYSPYSITYLTLLLYLANIGSSKEEIADLFGISSNNNDRNLIKLMFEINNELSNITNIKITNLLLIDHNYYDDTKQLFLQLLKKTCLIIPCDFMNDSQNIINKMNQFIFNITNGLINNIIDNLNLSSMKSLRQFTMLIINTICFKFNWKYKFKKLTTKNDVFHTIGGNEINISYMNQINEFYYYENNNLQIIELPNNDENLSFGIFLPKNNSTKIQNKFGNLQYLMKRKVEIFLPKFMQISHIDLKEIFIKLGCEKIFNITDAEFFNMIRNKDGLHISNMIHNAIIIIDENENRSETSVETISTKDYPIPQIKMVFNANHTFEYYIRHNSSNTIIFSGIFDGNNLI